MTATTNTAKTSPGPFKTRGRAGCTGHGVDDATGRSVCAIPSNGRLPLDQRNANAALLAASWDLRDALRALVNATSMTAPPELIADAMAALSKAEPQA
jgi:hypothetical protein